MQWVNFRADFGNSPNVNGCLYLLYQRMKARKVEGKLKVTWVADDFVINTATA